jgi:hypothetical protein
MVVLPGDTAVRRPELIFTVATLGLLLVHVTALFTAVVGSTVTVRFLVFPTMSDDTGLVICTSVTRLESFTVTWQESDLLPSTDTTLMVA